MSNDSLSEISSDASDESNPPLHAIPPQMSREEGSHRHEVGSNPAYQCLEELFEEGKISSSRMLELKSKYEEVHDKLKQVRQSESMYMEKAKKYTSMLEKQREILEDTDDSSIINEDHEIGRIRQDYLKKINELDQIEDRNELLRIQTETLNEELRLIQLEYSRIPKKHDLENKEKTMKIEIDETKKEIIQIKIDIVNQKESLLDKEQLLHAYKQDVEEKDDELTTLKGELLNIQNEPALIIKHTDKIHRNASEVAIEVKQEDKRIEELREEFILLHAKHHKLESEKNEVGKDVEHLRGQLKGKEYEFNTLKRDYEFEKERETSLLGDRALIEMNLRHASMNKKSNHDELSRMQRGNDRDLRTLKAKIIQEQYAVDIHNKMKAQLDKLTEEKEKYPANGPYYQKRIKLAKEVKEFKRKFAHEASLTAEQQVKVEDFMREEKRLVKQQNDLRNTVVDFHRLAQIKSEEREQKSRDLLRAATRYNNMVKELRNKKLSLVDHHKMNIEVRVKQVDFAKLYNVIKTERNKLVNHIQSCNQKSIELREKCRMLANELEILRTCAVNYDKEIQRSTLRLMNNMVGRDNLRGEENRQIKMEEQINEEKEQLKMEIGRLNITNNQAEDQMLLLRKKYEKNVQHRNERGVQLVEREEEVCIFYEKLNIQESIIINAEFKLNEAQDEVKYLNLQKSENLRLLELARKQTPMLKQLNEDLVNLQIQLSQCTDRKHQLEIKCEDSTKDERFRMLGGCDPSPEDLNKNIQDLEIKLAEKEEKLLEMELVFDQSQRLVDKLEEKVDSGKSDSLGLAKKVNDYQSKAKKITRKMMAIVSELSMKQAQVIQLQQTVKSQESTIQLAYQRLEQGEAPTEEIENEWIKMVRREQNKKDDRMRAEMQQPYEPEYHQLPDGSLTTCEPRPNAYLPTSGDNTLDISKPYGNHQPFKPNKQGANMRHMRKPTLKPIEF